MLACVVCGRLKSAFQIASRSGSVADVQYVAHQVFLPVILDFDERTHDFISSSAWKKLKHQLIAFCNLKK